MLFPAESSHAFFVECKVVLLEKQGDHLGSVVVQGLANYSFTLLTPGCGMMTPHVLCPCAVAWYDDTTCTVPRVLWHGMMTPHVLCRVLWCIILPCCVLWHVTCCVLGDILHVVMLCYGRRQHFYIGRADQAKIS